MFLTPQRKLSRVCPSCGKNFKENKGSSCLASCAEQQLAEKHQQIINKMFFYLLRQKIIVECPLGLSAKFAKSQGWGWTNDIAKIITIPWWTLRSKEEFFDTVAHEVAHIIAYQKKFASPVRKILQKWYKLEMNYGTTPSATGYQKLAKHVLQYEKEVEYYLTESEKNQGGHWYQEWYLEYRKLFKKLLKSPYKKYAYDYTQPRSYVFGDKEKKGK